MLALCINTQYQQLDWATNKHNHQVIIKSLYDQILQKVVEVET